MKKYSLDDFDSQSQLVSKSNNLQIIKNPKDLKGGWASFFPKTYQKPLIKNFNQTQTKQPKQNLKDFQQAIDIDILLKDKNKQSQQTKLNHSKANQNNFKITVSQQHALKLKQMILKKIAENQNKSKMKQNQNIENSIKKQYPQNLKKNDKKLSLQQMCQKRKKKQHQIIEIFQKKKLGQCTQEDLQKMKEIQIDSQDQSGNLLDQYHPQLQNDQQNRLQIKSNSQFQYVMTNKKINKDNQIQQKQLNNDKRKRKNILSQNQFQNIKKLINKNKKIGTNILLSEKASFQQIQNSQFYWPNIIFLFSKQTLQKPRKYLRSCHFAEASYANQNRQYLMLNVFYCLNYNLQVIPLLVCVWKQDTFNERKTAYYLMFKKFKQIYGQYPGLTISYFSQSLFQAQKMLKNQDRCRLALFPSYSLRFYRHTNLMANFDPVQFSTQQGQQLVKRKWSVKNLKSHYKFLSGAMRQKMMQKIRVYAFSYQPSTSQDAYQKIQEIWKQNLKNDQQLFNYVRNRYLKSNMKKTILCELKKQFHGLLILQNYQRQVLQLTQDLLNRKLLSRKPQSMTYHLINNVIQIILSNEQKVELNENKKIDDTPDYIQRMKSDTDFMIGENIFQLIRRKRQDTRKIQCKSYYQQTLYVFDVQNQINVREQNGRWKCSCNYQSVFGLPCDHLLKILQQKKIDWRQYIDKIYLKQ